MPVNPNYKPVRNPGSTTLNFGLRNYLNQTNLDVENPLPKGGPTSFPNYDHEHKYSPKNTYLNYSTPGGDGSGTHGDFGGANPSSDFGTTGVNVNPGRNIFKNGTNLDVEDSSPTGGPNGNNSYNIPNGTYTTTMNGNLYGNQGQVQAGGPLKDVDGQIFRNTVHQYNNKPGQKYLDQNLNPLPLPPRQSRLFDNINFPDINLPDIDFAGAFNVGGG
jgi:hypothetical protein